MPQLTQDQIKANIDALQAQGASNQDIQGWLDSLKTPTPTATPPTQGGLQTPEKPGFLGGLVQGITEPFVRTGVTAAKAIGGLGGISLGGIGKAIGAPGVQQAGLSLLQKSASTAPVKVPMLGGAMQAKPLTTVPQAIGAGAEIGSYALGGESLAKAGWKGALKLGAKVGAEMGGLAGFGRSLQGDDLSIGKTAAETIGGVAGGAVLGGITGGLIEGIKGLSDLPTLQGKMSDYFKKLLNLTPKQVALEEKWAKDTPSFLAKEGITGFTVDNGRLDANEAIGQLKTKSQAENQAFNKILGAENKYVSLQEFENKSIDSIKKTIKGSAQDNAIQQIKNEVAAYSKQYDTGIKNDAGDTLVRLDKFNEIKQDLWKKSQGVFTTTADKTASDVSFKAGKEAQGIIEDNLTTASAKKLNSRLGDFASATKILNNRQGTKVGASGLSRLFGRTIGAVLGAAGGPVDAIIGAVTGNKLADILANPEYSVAFTQKLINRLEQTGKDSIVQEAERILGQQAQEQASRLALPAAGEAGGKLGSPQNPIIPPAPTTYEKGVPKFKTESPTTLKAEGEIPKLEQEASKYKSAEEFVNSHEKVFRGGVNSFDIKKVGTQGVFVSPSEYMASTFGKNVSELYISPNAKVLSYDKLPKEFKDIGWDEAAKKISLYAQQHGYDVVDSLPANVDYPRGMERHVINPQVLKTKSQLIDIWNKANKANKAKPPTKLP